MSKVESDRQKPYEHPVARVKSGETFSFTPVLEQFPQRDTDYIESVIVEIKPFNMESIETGQVAVVRYPISLAEDELMVEPAGRVEPIEFWITINNVEEKDLGNIEVSMEYRGQTFFGEPICDEVAIRKEGKSPLMFYNWIDAKTGQECQPLFPPDPNILSQIRFSITKT